MADGDSNDHPSEFARGCSEQQPNHAGVNVAQFPGQQNAANNMPAQFHDQPKLYTQAELDDAIDRDRIAGFMAFSGFLNPQVPSMVHGTSHQALAIRRALLKAGYTA